MNKKTPQKKICRSWATCEDKTCRSCNSNPNNSEAGATTLDGAGNPLPKDPIACVNWESCRAHPHCDYCKESSGFNERHPELIKAVTPEVLPPETNALTHSRTNELLSTYTPGQVTEQWGRARTAQWHAINESLKLGAMLIDVEKSLVRETHKGGCFQTGDTLKAWLETNCPEVNYKTALRYRNAAEGLARQLGRANKVDGVQILIEADCREGCTPEAGRSHELVEKAIDGRSMRQMLMDLWGEEAKPQGGSREGSGRPTVKDVPAQTRAGACWAKIGHEIDLAQAWKFTRFLPIGIAKEALKTVTLLRDSLKERLEETKKGGIHVK